MLRESLEFPCLSSLLKANFLVSASPALRGAMTLEAVPAVFRRRRGITLGKLLVYHTATQKGKQQFSLKRGLCLCQGDGVQGRNAVA